MQRLELFTCETSSGGGGGRQTGDSEAAATENSMGFHSKIREGRSYICVIKGKSGLCDTFRSKRQHRMQKQIAPHLYTSQMTLLYVILVFINSTKILISKMKKDPLFLESTKKALRAMFFLQTLILMSVFIW